jgi:hypothetical protein
MGWGGRAGRAYGYGWWWCSGAEWVRGWWWCRPVIESAGLGVAAVSPLFHREQAKLDIGIFSRIVQASQRRIHMSTPLFIHYRFSYIYTPLALQ